METKTVIDRLLVDWMQLRKKLQAWGYINKNLSDWKVEDNNDWK